MESPAALDFPCGQESDDLRPLWHPERRPQPGRQPAGLLSLRDLARAGLLDLRGRQPEARRPDAGRLRDGRVAVPVHRHDRLHDRAAAGVPRGRARARARDQGRGGAAAHAREPHCRNCGHEIEPSFLRCPHCMRKLKEPCRSCGKPLDPRWRCARSARPRSSAARRPPPLDAAPAADRRRSGPPNAPRTSERTGAERRRARRPTDGDPRRARPDEPDAPPGGPRRDATPSQPDILRR